MPERISFHQLILALATIGSVSYLGTNHVISSDSVAAIIAGIAGFVTSNQQNQQREQNKLNGSN